MQNTVLIVDDEKEIADLVEIYLVSDGFRVLKAEDAKAGLSCIENDVVDLAILDIMLPEMDGLEMCKEIRKTKNIPIIFVTQFICLWSAVK